MIAVYDIKLARQLYWTMQLLIRYIQGIPGHSHRSSSRGRSRVQTSVDGALRSR